MSFKFEIGNLTKAVAAVDKARLKVQQAEIGADVPPIEPETSPHGDEVSRLQTEINFLQSEMSRLQKQSDSDKSILSEITLARNVLAQENQRLQAELQSALASINKQTDGQQELPSIPQDNESLSEENRALREVFTALVPNLSRIASGLHRDTNSAPKAADSLTKIIAIIATVTGETPPASRNVSMAAPSETVVSATTDSSQFPSFNKLSDASGSQVYRFFDDRITQVKGATLAATDLYEEYSEWCQVHQTEPLPMPAFTQTVAEIASHIKKQRVAGRIRYINLTLKEKNA